MEDEGGVGARQSVLVELHSKQSVPPQQPARARGLPCRALFCTYGCKELPCALSTVELLPQRHDRPLPHDAGLAGLEPRDALFLWRHAADGGKCSSAGAGRLRAARVWPELTARGIIDGYDVFDH